MHGKRRAQQQWSSLLCKAIEKNLTVDSVRAAKHSRDCMDENDDDYDDDEADGDKLGWQNETFRQEGARAWGFSELW